MKVLLKDLLAVWFDCDEIKKYGEMMARNIFVLLFSRAAQKKKIIVCESCNQYILIY